MSDAATSDLPVGDERYLQAIVPNVSKIPMGVIFFPEPSVNASDEDQGSQQALSPFDSLRPHLLLVSPAP